MSFLARLHSKDKKFNPKDLKKRASAESMYSSLFAGSKAKAGVFGEVKKQTPAPVKKLNLPELKAAEELKSKEQKEEEKKKQQPIDSDESSDSSSNESDSDSSEADSSNDSDSDRFENDENDESLSTNEKESEEREVALALLARKMAKVLDAEFRKYKQITMPQLNIRPFTKCWLVTENAFSKQTIDSESSEELQQTAITEADILKNVPSRARPLVSEELRAKDLGEMMYLKADLTINTSIFDRNYFKQEQELTVLLNEKRHSEEKKSEEYKNMSPEERALKMVQKSAFVVAVDTDDASKADGAFKPSDEVEANSVLKNMHIRPVAPNIDPVKDRLNPLNQAAKPAETAGKDWFNMAAPELTTETKQDLLALKMKNAMSGSRGHVAKPKSLPKFFQIGTIVEGPTEFFSRVPKKQRARSLLEEFSKDAEVQNYVTQRYASITEKNIAKRKAKPSRYNNSNKKQRTK